MRFLGPITHIAKVYKDAIEEINNGYAGDSFVLNDKTNRIDNYDVALNSGYYFKNDIYKLVEQVSEEIKNNPHNINFSRVLAYKNSTVDLLNKNIRKYIYGEYSRQFEKGEIVISKGGFTLNKQPIIHNGKILKVEETMDVVGPFNIPCLSIKFKDLITAANIVVVKDTTSAQDRYNSIKNELLGKAERDSRQWVHYYSFLEKFAYFDYAYAVNTYKAQGQTLNNVYVIESEIMGVKPLTLKQKFQALYVAMTRASENLYIYNKNY